MAYEVVQCVECGKPIKSVPSWLAGVNVKFSCESCRQKHPRPFLGADAATPIQSVQRNTEDEEPIVASPDADDEEAVDDAAGVAEDEPALEEIAE